MEILEARQWKVDKRKILVIFKYRLTCDKCGSCISPDYIIELKKIIIIF